MAKKWKKLSKMEKRLLKELEERDWEVKSTLAQFYPDGVLAEFDFPGAYKDAFGWWYENEMICLNELTEAERQKELEMQKQKYDAIRHNVEIGKHGNAEICLDEGVVRCGSAQYILDNFIVKIKECENSPNANYSFLRAGDRCNARIMIGDEYGDTYLTVVGKEYEILTRLDEFYLLGLCKDMKIGNEMGIVIPDPGKTGPCGLLYDFWFNQIRELLQKDWFQDKWVEAKIEAEEEFQKIKNDSQKIINHD